MIILNKSTSQQLNPYSALIARVRATQQQWAAKTLKDRLQIVRRLRGSLAHHANSLLRAFPADPQRVPAERLASELIPFAEACRFLERETNHILASRRATDEYRPFWLRHIEVEERREPLGLILIIGAQNYPFFLPGVQVLQALVAGNAAIVKPGRGGGPIMRDLQTLFMEAGLPPNLFVVLDEEIQEVEHTIRQGVDKVIFTGSTETGRNVYRLAADHLTPVILELSGEDPVFVLKSADLERAADAIAFGLSWNAGKTCIAPKRLFVAESIAEMFNVVLQIKFPDAIASLPILPFRDEEEAIMLAAQSPYALGASIFGDPHEARALAERIRAGVVVINDLIVPTSDPRVAFGGRDQSGFGKTRGAEGLKEMTILKFVIVQRAKRLRHLEGLPKNAADLFLAYLSASHSCTWRERLSAGFKLVNIALASRWTGR
jgi:acyl-CoA reductase-like NAD-dependent aldehyde dehydrogenase